MILSYIMGVTALADLRLVMRVPLLLDPNHLYQTSLSESALPLDFNVFIMRVTALGDLHLVMRVPLLLDPNHLHQTSLSESAVPLDFNVFIIVINLFN